MTLIDQQASVVAWNEPAGLTPRGTLIVIPGRGELPALYERLGRRLAGDAYRVRVVPDPTTDTASVRAQVTDYLSDPGSPAPRVLVGSDTGALFAVILAVSGGFPSVDAVVLAARRGPVRRRERDLATALSLFGSAGLDRDGHRLTGRRRRTEPR